MSVGTKGWLEYLGFPPSLADAACHSQTFLPSISPPPYLEYAQVIIDEGVKIVETAGSAAAAPAIKMFREAGIYVIHKCTSIKHAQAAVRKMGVK